MPLSLSRRFFYILLALAALAQSPRVAADDTASAPQTPFFEQDPSHAALAKDDAIPLPHIPAGTFNILDYGAVADGKTLNTSAIQKTLDACTAAGGGTVLIPAGKYLTGPLTLASNLNFHLAAGARLLLTNDIPTYPTTNGGGRYLNGFSASHAHDIEISGPGIIDGQGDPWWKAFRTPGNTLVHRPNLIVLANCTTVLVENITLQNSPQFHLVPQHCTDVTIRGVTITAPPTSPNTDAIDPSGWHFLITHCITDIGDDNVAIKASGKPGDRPACQDFTITDCTMLHGHGLSIGGQTGAGVDGLFVSNCTFNGTTSGIRLKASRSDGGLVQNLHYANLTMTNVQHPIYITSYYPKEPKSPEDDPAQPIPAGAPRPIWRDISFSHLTITDCPTAGTLWGLPELPISNLTFTNVHISATEGMKIYFASNITFTRSTITASAGPALLLYKSTVSGLPNSFVKN